METLLKSRSKVLIMNPRNRVNIFIHKDIPDRRINLGYHIKSITDIKEDILGDVVCVEDISTLSGNKYTWYMFIKCRYVHVKEEAVEVYLKKRPTYKE